jgi:hypothetical protein
METMGIEANPYQVGGMIRNHDQFIGREREIRDTLSRVATLQSVSVTGERRIGKSSLLQHITATGRKRLGDSYPEHEFFYLDVQPIESAEEFYDRACRLIKCEEERLVGAVAAEDATRDKADLEDAIAGRKVVLSLDEFEQAIEADFGADFFKHLRHLAQTGNLALIVATKTSLSELYRRDEELTSGFSNIFTQLQLGELTGDEARQLVTAPRNGHRFSQEEADLILEIAGNHPYRLNLACALFYDAEQDGLIREGRVPEDVRNRLRADFRAKLAASADIKIGAGSTAQPSSASTGEERVPTRTTVEAASTTAAATNQAARADRAIRISVALSLVAGVLAYFATEYPNPIGLILSTAFLLVSLGFLIATRIMWPKETRRGEQ